MTGEHLASSERAALPSGVAFRYCGHLFSQMDDRSMRVALPALTDADQRTLRRLYARCDGLVTAARDAQAALAPYLREKAA